MIAVLAVMVVSLFLLPLFSTVGALESHCGDTAQTETISVLHENVTQGYGSLQEAVDHSIAISQSHSLSQGIPTICLPQGHHRITKQTMFYESSIVLVGTQNTTIECDYDPLPFEEGFHYTWHFNQSRLVQFENISFINCPYPFRVIAVQNVTLRDCTFR